MTNSEKQNADDVCCDGSLFHESLGYASDDEVHQLCYAITQLYAYRCGRIKFDDLVGELLDRIDEITDAMRRVVE